MKVCLSKTKILFASLSTSIKYNMLETRFLTLPAKWLYFKLVQVKWILMYIV